MSHTILIITLLQHIRSNNTLNAPAKKGFRRTPITPNPIRRNAATRAGTDSTRKRLPEDADFHLTPYDAAQRGVRGKAISKERRSADADLQHDIFSICLANFNQQCYLCFMSHTALTYSHYIRHLSQRKCHSGKPRERTI